MTCPQVVEDNNLLMSVAVLYFTKHTNNTYIIVLIIHLIYEHVTNNYFIGYSKTSYNQQHKKCTC